SFIPRCICSFTMLSFYIYNFCVVYFYSCNFSLFLLLFFFFNDTATTEIYTLSLHDALPIFAFLLLLSLLLPSLLIMFIPSTFKRPVSSWKALNLRKTLLMASSVRLKPLNCSRLPCVYAQETLTFLLTQKKTCVKNYVQKE